MTDTATLSDVVDAWTEATIYHCLAREAVTAQTMRERQYALDALHVLGRHELADALAIQGEER